MLACAFTCSPPGTPGFQGGEHLLGWNLLIQIARFQEVWAITHAPDRESIEPALANLPNPNLHFQYVGLPKWLGLLLRIQGGHQFYYHLWQLKAYFAARKMHKSLNFQLFHHITYANDWLANFIGAFLPVPYVRGPGGGAHRTPKGFESEYSLKGQVWERIRSIGQWFFRHDPVFLRGQERARAILVCNRDSLNQIPDKWAHKAHLYPVSGISLDNLPAASDATPNGGEFKILSAGSLIGVKGFGLAIRSFQEFAKNQPNAKLNIIGSGPEEQRLRALVQENHLDENVCLMGWKPQHEVLAEMAAHDVFLFPSLRDGGGTVVIEAMAVGRPVVCLDIGGPGLHVTEETGLKITASSPQQTIRGLADALQRLFDDQELRVAMGRAARVRARESYGWDQLGDRLLKIYQDSLSPVGD